VTVCVGGEGKRGEIAPHLACEGMPRPTQWRMRVEIRARDDGRAIDEERWKRHGTMLAG